MFDIAPTELLLVAVIALVVIGPKDLPRAMRFVGKWLGKARGMARHFRSGLDTMMRESELEELEKQWRQQNDDIMREFPRIDDQPAAAGPETVPEMIGQDDGMRPAQVSATPPMTEQDAPASPPKGEALP